MSRTEDRLYIASWAALLAVNLLGEGVGWATGIIVSLPLPLVAAFFVLVAIAFIYREREPRLAQTALIVFWSFMTTVSHIILTYSSLRLGRRLVTPVLFAADRALGFDWVTYFWLISGSIIRGPLVVVYGLTGPLTMVALVVAIWRNESRRVAQYMALSTVLLCVIEGIFALFPAKDAATQAGLDYAPSRAWSSLIDTLQSGAPMALGVNHLDGIVSFPSVHTAGVLLLGWFVWAWPPMRLPAAGLVILTLLAIPVAGAHFLIDVITGACLTLAALGCLRWRHLSAEMRAGTQSAAGS